MPKKLYNGFCIDCGVEVDLKKLRCLPCSNSKRNSYRKKDKEKTRKYNRDYYRRNSEKVKEIARRNYLRHKHRVIEYAKRWNKTHKRQRVITMVFQNQKRRSRLKANGGRGFNNRQWKDLLIRSGGKCVYCRKAEATSMDHIYPISLGGGHDVYNIVPACRMCNSTKRAYEPLRWILENHGNDGWNHMQSVKHAYSNLRIP